MQKRFGKTKLHTIKQEADQKKNRKGLHSNIKQTDQMKEHSITTQKVWKWWQHPHCAVTASIPSIITANATQNHSCHAASNSMKLQQ